MENDDTRYIATALIWIGAGLGIGLTNVNSGDLGIYNALISMSIAFGATVATLAMLGATDSSKAKRNHQTNAGDDYSNLLVQLMTDEERQTMRTRLINNVSNDGELFPPTEAPTEKQNHSY